MAILGIILIVAGAGSIVYGIMQNNSLEAQLTSFLTSGQTNPGTMWIVIGAVAAVVGVILLAIGMKKKNG